MEQTGCIQLSEEMFLQQALEEINAIVGEETEYETVPTTIAEEHNVSSVCSSAISKCNEVESKNESKEPKRKRRSNLGEFSETQATKRKNESSKRELTSIVNQLAKIDKQLNADKDESRVSINFIATFTSFKSNRVNTFKYPPDAEIKQTLLDFDTTVYAVKNAVKEAMNEVIKELRSRKTDDTVPTSSSTSSSAVTDAFVTPTKTTAAIKAFPSATTEIPFTSSRSLCVKNSCSFGEKLEKIVWVKCYHRNEAGLDCNYWVHAPCIGFPTLTDERLECWYCPDHTEMVMKRN